jgi:protein gp37
MNKTGISYLTHTWNPIAMRCTPVSEGCANCWHLTLCKRQAANHILTAERRAAAAGGPFVLLEDELTAPLRLRQPATIGVQFMGDLFHEDIDDDSIAKIWSVMGLAGDHTFVVLTKRIERMREWVSTVGMGGLSGHACDVPGIERYWKVNNMMLNLDGPCAVAKRPLCNVYLGVSAENQYRADERIPLLLETPAAIKFVSVEPVLGPIEFGNRYLLRRTGESIDWLIIGCESGAHRRPCKLEWVQPLVEEASRSAVPVFIKQLDIDGKVSTDPTEWPPWARRQEYPRDISAQ